MEPHEKVSQRSRGKIIIDNFLGGISWSLGVWFGTTIVIAIIIYLLAKIDYIPFVGNFVVSVMDYIGKNTNPFRIGH